MVLASITLDRDPAVLSEIRQKAFAAIVEMARWKSSSHAYAAFVILGRLSGADEKTLIEENFSQNWPAEIERMRKMGSL